MLLCTPGGREILGVGISRTDHLQVLVQVQNIFLGLHGAWKSHALQREHMMYRHLRARYGAEER